MVAGALSCRGLGVGAEVVCGLLGGPGSVERGSSCTTIRVFVVTTVPAAGIVSHTQPGLAPFGQPSYFQSRAERRASVKRCWAVVRSSPRTSGTITADIPASMTVREIEGINSATCGAAAQFGRSNKAMGSEDQMKT